jgi:hypothetical protein
MFAYVDIAYLVAGLYVGHKYGDKISAFMSSVKARFRTAKADAVAVETKVESAADAVKAAAK